MNNKEVKAMNKEDELEGDVEEDEVNAKAMCDTIFWSSGKILNF